MFEIGGQKKGCFSGREGIFEVAGQDKGHISGRVVCRQKKETPSKGCLCSYLVIRFLDSLRSLEMTVGR